MAEFIENLPDGWTIYVWMIAAAAILIAAAFGLRWAFKNNQFNEDIKYVVFDETDKDNMDPSEYNRSREVMKEQEAERDKFLKEKEKLKALRDAKR